MAEKMLGVNTSALLFSLSACCFLLWFTRADWVNHGRDHTNRRFAADEVMISPSTVSRLKLKWEFFAGRDITATPAVADGVVYFPCWNGYIYAVAAGNGSLVWKKNLEELTGFKGTGLIANVTVTVSRATPVVASPELLIVGIYGPAAVAALHRWTGDLVWLTRLDSHFAAVVTMSGTAYDRAFYVGTSSLEEDLPIKECCTFRGSIAKLDLLSGTVLWQTFTLPDNHGQRGQYAGAAVWGSSPSVDVRRNLVYLATGNLYSAPAEVLECQERQNNMTVPDNPNACIEPENHGNSIMAVGMECGEIRWSRVLGGYDVWILACVNRTDENCPPGPNVDADFGEAPMLLAAALRNGTRTDVAVAVQKSGVAWALDRDNGETVWSSVAGPGGLTGGGTWGAATNGKIVYTNIANEQGRNFTLKPSKQVTTAGGWVAMDANTGKVLWSTANPSNATSNGPVTLANGVLFAGSTDGRGPIYAMHGMTGEVLWSYNTGATVYGGISVSHGCAYLGNGYKVALGVLAPALTAGTSLYAFCVY